jgi:hypothetical protein
LCKGIAADAGHADQADYKDSSVLDSSHKVSQPGIGWLAWSGLGLGRFATLQMIPFSGYPMADDFFKT